MKKIWSSSWRPYWIFSLFIFAVAATSWWWQASHWQGARTVASVKQAQLHPDFFAGLEDKVYPSYLEKFKGTNVCKHYLFENRAVSDKSFIKDIIGDLNEYCIQGSAIITDLAQNVSSDHQLFIGCCDMDNRGPAHFRYELKSSGMKACKHFILSNEHSGMRVFFNDVSSHINRFCHPKTVSIAEDIGEESDEFKVFNVCCEINVE